MNSLWNDEEAGQWGGDPLALRVYSSRLLGRDPSLVLHGGGNTSVKASAANIFGESEELLYVKGSGKFLVNKKDISEYFVSKDLIDIARASLEKTGKTDSSDINIIVSGGGKKGQAEAVCLATARVLVLHNQDLKPQLRTAGFVSVDSRVKERKKPGLKRARRAPQWSKR